MKPLNIHQALNLRSILTHARRMIEDGMTLRSVRDDYLAEQLVNMSDLEVFADVYNMVATSRIRKGVLEALTLADARYCEDVITAHHKRMAHIRYVKEQRARVSWDDAWTMAHEEQTRRALNACQVPAAPPAPRFLGDDEVNMPVAQMPHIPQSLKAYEKPMCRCSQQLIPVAYETAAPLVQVELRNMQAGDVYMRRGKDENTPWTIPHICTRVHTGGVTMAFFDEDECADSLKGIGEMFFAFGSCWEGQWYRIDSPHKRAIAPEPPRPFGAAPVPYLESVEYDDIQAGEAFYVRDIHGAWHGPYVCASKTPLQMGVFIARLASDKASRTSYPQAVQLAIGLHDLYFRIKASAKL